MLGCGRSDHVPRRDAADGAAGTRGLGTRPRHRTGAATPREL